MKIKNIIAGVLVMIITITCLAGCGSKLISTESENVEVNIIDEYHRGMYVTPMRAGKVTTMITHPAVYRITVEYNDVEYTISGSETYHKYKDMIGQTTTGTLQIRTYEDGSVKYDIVSLK